FFSERGGDALAELTEQPELRDIEALCSTRRGVGGTIRVDYTRENRASIENVEPAVAREKYADGCTVYITNLATEAISRWRHSLDVTLGLPPGTAIVNAFASMPGPGLRWHWDAHELFILHVRGRKRWRTAPNRYVECPTMNGYIGAFDS